MGTGVVTKAVAPDADDIEAVCHDLGTLHDTTARAPDALRPVEVMFFDVVKPMFLPVGRYLLLILEAEKRCGGEDGSAGDSGEEPVLKDRVVLTMYELHDGVSSVCHTAPNTGGKTLAVKTLGFVFSMSNECLFVPAIILDDVFSHRMVTTLDVRCAGDGY